MGQQSEPTCFTCRYWRRLRTDALIGRCDGLANGDIGYTQALSVCSRHAGAATPTTQLRNKSEALQAESRHLVTRAAQLTRALTTNVEITRQIAVELTTSIRKKPKA